MVMMRRSIKDKEKRKRENKMLVISLDYLIDWHRLFDLLSKDSFTHSLEKEYLYEKTKYALWGMEKEEILCFDYKYLLKKEFYEIIHLSLSLKKLEYVSKIKERCEVYLLSTLKHYDRVLKEHIILFDKIFSPYSYNYTIYDKRFWKILEGYFKGREKKEMHFLTYLPEEKIKPCISSLSHILSLKCTFSKICILE